MSLIEFSNVKCESFCRCVLNVNLHAMCPNEIARFVCASMYFSTCVGVHACWSSCVFVNKRIDGLEATGAPGPGDPAAI